MKRNIIKLKEDIKLLSSKQKVLKNQRKTVNLKGERIIDPYKALWEHISNRSDLFHMYIAYAKLRNRFERMKIKEGTPINEKEVNKYIENYGETICPDKE